MKNKNINIALYDAKAYDINSFNNANTDFGFKINYLENNLTAETVRYAQGCQAVCAFVNDDLGPAVLDELEKLNIKLIAMRCAGFNNVDLGSAADRIKVVRVPAYSPYAVAEHTLAMILTLNRKTHRAYFRVRDNNFSLQGLLGFDMHGKTLGVIGTGRIGKTFIAMMRGFGMKILAYDMYPDQKFAAENNFSYVDKETVYSQSDIISLHCPLTDETFHLVDKQALAQMKTGVMLVNTSRGKLVDTAALIEALKSGRVGSAALDVYEEESEYFFVDYSDRIILNDELVRLTSFNNVLVTSHQAFFTKEALANIAATTLENIKEFVDGKKLTNEICTRCSEK
ncbi:MAG: 2-hydroxyacid dehydrogenase [Victivallaceae bacterium]|nr:2-hydroxyacid dehydrogenase [Victivallaceae bacterium]MDD4180138.1 2-hydroxyacid dehydrogenase [Victivallaceae bacterium]